MADKLNVSRASLRMHLREMIKLGWVIDDKANNLIRFAGRNDLKEYYKTSSPVHIPQHINDLKEIKELIKSIAIISNIKSQEKQICKKNGRINNIMLGSDHKKSDQATRRELQNAINPKLEVSRNKLSEILNVESLTTVTRRTNFLHKKGILRKKHHLEVLAKNCQGAYIDPEEDPQVFVGKNGTLYKRLCNSYHLTYREERVNKLFSNQTSFSTKIEVEVLDLDYIKTYNKDILISLNTLNKNTPNTLSNTPQLPS